MSGWMRERVVTVVEDILNTIGLFYNIPVSIDYKKLSIFYVV
jgi:hypothetical protein